MLKRFSDARLIKTIAVLLAALGILLLIEVAFPFGSITGMPRNEAFIFVLGVFIGLGVGMVSSLLGVAGGELLIPVLIFIFGADVRTSGTAAIVISLAIVSFGLWRYHRLGMIPKGRGIRRITAAMTVGAFVGAFLGGLALSFAPVEFLKMLLGFVLLASAVKTYRKAPAELQS